MLKEDNSKIEKTLFQAIENHKKNNFKDAEKLYNEILKTNPNHFQVICLLGSLKVQIRNLKQAKELFEKAIKINPNEAEPQNNLGIIFQEFEEPEKAINCYQKAIKIQSNYIPAHNNLGLAFKEMGEHEKAINCFQKVIEIEPNNSAAYNNLGIVHKNLSQREKAINCFEKAIKLKPNSIPSQINISNFYASQLDNLEKAVSESYKTLKVLHNTNNFINKTISYSRLKHDVQQAGYLISKNYKINGIDEFQKIGNEILERKENKESNKSSNKKILLNQNEIKTLSPYCMAYHIYQIPKISETAINADKNWSEVEKSYLNSSNQIIYIDNFLSNQAIKELREFCLVSKIWNQEYPNKYLGSFSERGFISPIHLKIAIELKEKLPRLFGKHNLDKFWGFKYDSTLGKGINIHADFALINLNFWITPDEYNNNKKKGGLKVYDTPAPEDWTFAQYNRHPEKIYTFLKDNNANCTNVPYKFNRAVLFNSAYFHETDEINFKDEYEARRINITYLFGSRLVKKIKIIGAGEGN